MEIKDRIKYTRLSKNITQEELGKILGLQKAAIQKYENGSVENIKRSVIQKMSECLNVSPLYLLGYVDDPTYKINSEKSQIETLYNRLDEIDKVKAIAFIEGLLSADKYIIETTRKKA